MKHIILTLYFVVFATELHYRQTPVPNKDIANQERNGKYLDQLLVVSFSVKNGSLATTMVGGGYNFIDLSYLPSQKQKRAIIVNTLNDLKGYVSIKTPKQALEYVRLLTSPETYSAFHPFRVEVVSVKYYKPLWLDAVLKSMGISQPLGVDGILSERVANSLGISPPMVTLSQHGFYVRRTLAQKDPTKNDEYGAKITVKKVCEFVGEDGVYSLLTSKLVQRKDWNKHISMFGR